MSVKKYYNEEGKVAVLYSPGYGAGWSTWCGSDEDEFLIFDKTLVSMALNKVSEEEVEKYLKKHNIDVYCGGWEDVEVEFLDVGTQFIIEEYDGNESITINTEINWNVA